jgi:hypothetical protein
MVISDLAVEANTTASGSGVFGILLHGAVGAGFISNVLVHRSDGACLRVQTDAGTGKVPDQWIIENNTFAASRSSYGVQIDDLPDSRIWNCLSHNNQLDNWNIGSFGNTTMGFCRGENSGTGRGFHFTGLISGQDCGFLECTTQLNDLDGFFFDDTGTTQLGTYRLAACRSNGDNVSGGALGSGFRSAGSTSRIMMDGCFATGAQYGTYEGSASYGMALTGCYNQGATAATFDDGSNTHALSNLVPVPF